MQKLEELYPSPLINVLIKDDSGDRSIKIKLPEKELFRVRDVFSRQEYKIYSKYLPSEGLTIVDVGANVGLFALYMKLNWKDSEIYCFEPALHTFKLLEANMTQLSGIKCFAYGLANQSATVNLFLHPHNTGQNSIKHRPEISLRNQ
ncbi:MAG: FkbM family methyltransferase [Desulfobacteraceae bacterium]|nr:FkbM family methyltransferase [Desulfobacteraceae bacterium]